MIEPGFLDELDTFEFELKRRVSSVFQGRQETSQTGDGLVFVDHRRYSPGDDVRLVDWNLLARSDELFVKQFEEERNLTVHVLLDSSASMAFGEPSKFEVGAKIGLGYAYLSASENNDYRFSTFDRSLRRLDRRVSNRGEVLRVVDELNAMEPRGVADIGGAMDEYSNTIDSKSLVVVVSDFLPSVRSMRDGVGEGATVIAESTGVEYGAASLSDSHLLLVQVLTPQERELPMSGDTIFQASESDAGFRTYMTPRRRGIYLERLERHVDDVGEAAERHGGDHVLVDTSDDFFESFSKAWLD